MATKKPDVDPFTAMESLRAALRGVGVVLPSLGVDVASPALQLVELGRVRADVAARLADVLRNGGRVTPVEDARQ
ncbi:hypothetical protein ACIPWL_01225 [Streptomyces sp. NPDC090023]|uniref:hypothetical protein n=1 Tax=unclassified Streptomyces TaxID=2593676 RepID=UPI0037F9A237